MNRSSFHNLIRNTMLFQDHPPRKLRLHFPLNRVFSISLASWVPSCTALTLNWFYRLSDHNPSNCILHVVSKYFDQNLKILNSIDFIDLIKKQYYLATLWVWTPKYISILQHLHSWEAKIQLIILFMSIQAYINTVNKRWKSGISTEHSYRGDLEELLRRMLPKMMITNEPTRISCGAPDFILTRRDVPVGYIEAKDIGEPLTGVKHKE